MKAKLFIFLLLLTFAFTNAQQRKLSDEAEISVLTIGAGTSLNDAFGHSGFRIKDPISHTDIVFNYGVYDFDTPNFYTKFAQGKLNYLIGLNYYEDFYESYVSQNRTVKEQKLNLSHSEKQQLFDYLINNYKPENRAYLYDFFYDNCATRIKDVLENSLEKDIVFNTPKNLKAEKFRTLIQNELDWNSWGSLGIDIALGSVIDKKATPEEYMFLPKNIYSFFESATYNKKPLIKQSHVLFNKREVSSSTNFIISPLFIFGLISLIILIITLLDYKKKKRSKWLDIILFSITGLIGIFILLLWFATDHSATGQNYNLLWAFALNVLVIGEVLRKTPKLWFIKYLKFLIIMLCLMVFHWLVGVQVFAYGLIPLILALFIRYFYLINFYKGSLLTSKK